MKINTIKIKNFRGIPDMEISLERISFFTGPCGAGKTSVLKAFNFALTGDVKKDDIREQSDRASATIVFEDQSSIQRICKLSAATQVKVNGKNSTAKAADEFLQAKLGTSTDIFLAMCKTDFFEVLSQKEQTEFFLSILPTKISFEKLCEFIGENNKKLTEEEKTTLKTAFANISDPFGLDEIDMAYKYFYQKRKEKKAFVENLKPRAVFDMSILPEESKENTYTYGTVRTAMEEEARKKNYILSWIYSEMIGAGVQHMETLKEKYQFISNRMNYAYRLPGNKNGSLFDEAEIHNILKGYGFAFSQMLTSKIKDCVKKGLLEGKVSLPSYKIDSPFTIAKACMGFSHDYDNFEELCEHIHDSDLKLYFDYGGNKKPSIARFKINLGKGKNQEELAATLLKLYSGEYEYCGSSIQISKKKIILNLSMKIPKIPTELDENTVVGVNLGVAIPATCALNNDLHKKLYIGTYEEFAHQKVKLQEQRKRLQMSLRNTSGGHGRKKKLQALERLKAREKQYTETVCHKISKQIVDFALKNHAKYINLENLQGYDTNEFILRNWCYYRLQQYTEYKAARYGIIVRKVNPCYNAQICSICGGWDIDQRLSRADFICKDPNCISHKKYKHPQCAEFNNARNVAMSELFMESGKVTGKDFERARAYYSKKNPGIIWEFVESEE